MDNQREVPLDEGEDSVNDEFAPPISPDPAIPPERDPLAGQPFPERDETGPYGLDREATESVETDDTEGGVPASEYADQRMKPVDAGREDSGEAWPESRGGWDDRKDAR